jgi:hypothetical protein
MCSSDNSLNRNSKHLVHYCKGPLLFLFYMNDIAVNLACTFVVWREVMCAQPVVFLRGQKTLTGIEPVTTLNMAHYSHIDAQQACNTLTQMYVYIKPICGTH